MGQLMLRCPMTDRNFSTGIDTDRATLKRVSYTRIAARCPYCGREHSWGPQDAPLEQSVPPLGKHAADPVNVCRRGLRL